MLDEHRLVVLSAYLTYLRCPPKLKTVHACPFLCIWPVLSMQNIISHQSNEPNSDVKQTKSWCESL